MIVVNDYTVNQITELTDLTEQNLPTLTTFDCHGNALTNAKNINTPTLRKLYLVIISIQSVADIASWTLLHYRQIIRLIH